MCASRENEIDDHFAEFAVREQLRSRSGFCSALPLEARDAQFNDFLDSVLCAVADRAYNRSAEDA
jgi:hypothetical protein